MPVAATTAGPPGNRLGRRSPGPGRRIPGRGRRIPGRGRRIPGRGQERSPGQRSPGQRSPASGAQPAEPRPAEPGLDDFSFAEAPDVGEVASVVGELSESAEQPTSGRPLNEVARSALARVRRGGRGVGRRDAVGGHEPGMAEGADAATRPGAATGSAVVPGSGVADGPDTVPVPGTASGSGAAAGSDVATGAGVTPGSGVARRGLDAMRRSPDLVRRGSDLARRSPDLLRRSPRPRPAPPGPGTARIGGDREGHQRRGPRNAPGRARGTAGWPLAGR